jgi:antitoxin (DNA-binding transcriptional repressor) of toxin-antitoxin stability system
MGIDEARPKLGDLAAEAYENGTVTILTSHRIPIAQIGPLDPGPVISIRGTVSIPPRPEDED